MKNKIIRAKRARRIRFRSIYSTNNLDEFKEKTYKYRKFFFRNVYFITEAIPELKINTRYLELRTMRKVYRYYMF